MLKHLIKYKYEVILGILILTYIFYFSLASFLRYDNFYAGKYDLGNMAQAVWNTINGRIFQASNENGEIISRLASHADFILILLSPIYLFWQNPKSLLLIQTIGLAFGAIFIYLISRRILKSKLVSLALGLLFLANPPVQFTNLYDFHAVTLATTFLLGSFYFLIRRSYFWLIVFLILSGICKEQIWLINSLFGIPLLFNKKTKIKIIGTAIFFVSISIFVLLISYIIPQTYGKQHFALEYFSEYGNSPSGVIKNIILSPNKVISTIFEESRLAYLKQLFMPLGFISLLSPLYLIFAIPDLLISLLSNNAQLRQIYYQYTSAITPFIFISAIFSIKKILKIKKVKKVYVIAYLFFFTIFSAYISGPLPFSKKPNTEMFTKPLKNREVIERFLLTIPQNHSVAATNNLGAHLSHRQIIFTIPEGIQKADFVLFLLNDQHAQPSLEAQREMAKELKNNTNYIKLIENEDFIAFKKVKYFVNMEL